MQRLVFYGDDIVRVELPERTRVIEPPPPITPLSDYQGAVRASLREPLGCPPLAELVGPESRVTIAFDDPCLPLPPVLHDPRGLAVEAVLEELFSLGVQRERVSLICAVGLHRKWTERELKHVLGKRVWAVMGPSHIGNHDAEDPVGNVDLGACGEGYPVEVNRALLESDLTIYVNVNWTSMNGGWKSYMVGLGTYRSIRPHHNASVLIDGGTIMDPGSDFHAILRSQGRHLARHANLMSVETVLNNRVWPGPLDSYLSLKKDRVPLPFKLSRYFPQAVKSAVSSSLRSAYAPMAVHAGDPDAVHAKTLEALFRQQNVRVEGQSDALFLALPNICPYAAFSRMNPLLAMNSALGYVFNLHMQRPVVRKGGVLVLMQPFLPGFHNRHHLPYIEFYDKVLAETRDSREMEVRFEENFADRKQFIEAYRHHYAYHGVHPFYVWYWGGLAMEHLERVIVVGAKQQEVVEHLGFEYADSLQRAWDMASEILGKDHSVTHLSIPPIFATEVV
jgi:Lactate racemase N-terminal domain